MFAQLLALDFAAPYPLPVVIALLLFGPEALDISQQQTAELAADCESCQGLLIDPAG